MALGGNHSTIECLHLMSPVVKDVQHPLLYCVIFCYILLYSVIFCYIRRNAGKESSKFTESSTVILEMQAAWNLPSSASTVTVAYRMARNFQGLKFSQISLD